MLCKCYNSLSLVFYSSECRYWDVSLVVVFSTVMLAGVTTEHATRPPPTFEILEEGNFLSFRGHPPNIIDQSSHCWKYMFKYSKCKEKPLIENATEYNNWTVKIGYDSACKYTVQAQAIYDVKYCGNHESHSVMSEPMYYGQDGDPNLHFKVIMILIPVVLCCYFIIALVLFKRFKKRLFPKVPSPLLFLTDILNSNQEIAKKGQYIGEVYKTNEEMVEVIHVEPKPTHRL